MYQKAPMTDRVKRTREKYRSTKPAIDISRYKIATEFTRDNPQLFGMLYRANLLYELFEKMPTPIREDEIIVGYPGEAYRSSPLFPENCISWLKDELDDLPTRSMDPYDISDEDKEYIRSTFEFWDKRCSCAYTDPYRPETYKPLLGNGVLNFFPENVAPNPIGHYCGNFWKVLDPGIGAIHQEAVDKMRAMEDEGIKHDEAKHYIFYRGVEIVTRGFILYTKRYAKEAARQAKVCTDPVRKAELLEMADSLDWIIEKPARTFKEAAQAVFLYQLANILDAQLHGLSLGRVDQYLGKYYDADIAAGRITPEDAQEIIDMFILKLAECNKLWSTAATRTSPGYTAGQLITIGGVDKDGNDASNAVTYMILQANGRMALHNPPVALRIHDGTPDELWEAAIECNKQAGGVPSFEYDNTIISGFMKYRNIPLEDARNFALMGCVEPAVCGADFTNPGGDGSDSYTILPAALLCAINNGTNPYHMPGTPEPRRTGLETGYLYEMNSIEEVMDAFDKQMGFFLKWQMNMVNVWDFVTSTLRPLPLLSSTLDGCMESGLDVMWGGSKYNGTGNSSIGHGNVADALNIINQLCFVEKKCTTRELYDAVMANWEGYEELHGYIKGKAVHFGNNNKEADKFLKFVADCYADHIRALSGPRSEHWSPGCWPVTLNVAMGQHMHATPDGRSTGDPLSDGISPVQGMDTNGPFSTINSILKFDQDKYTNGTLCNMKIHPTSLQGDGGWQKLQALIKTYFKGGGMELQLNIISSDTLREAQTDPEKYKDLVVRVAGFSAYFVEVYKAAQDDLIHRTELSM